MKKTKQEKIEEIEKGCGRSYTKAGLVFECGARIYGIDLCPECEKILEKLK